MTFIAIGGAEDKKNEKHVLKRVIAESGKANPKICVVTTATGYPKEVKKKYQDVFTSLGIPLKDITVLHVNTRDKAKSKKYITPLNTSDVIFMSGGNQTRLTSSLAGTPFLRTMMAREKEGAVIAGTSAGAVVMSDLMVTGGSAQYAMEKGEVSTNVGFRFADHVAFESHMDDGKVNRISRLFNIIATNPSVLGVGLDEDTGVVIKDHIAEVIGRGEVTFVDGDGLKTNIAEVSHGKKFKADGYRVDKLKSGEKYNLQHRQKM